MIPNLSSKSFRISIDNLQKDVHKINERLIKVETKQDAIAMDAKELKGSIKALIWIFIGILVTAVGGFVISGKPSLILFFL